MTCWSVFYHHKTPKVQSSLLPRARALIQARYRTQSVNCNGAASCPRAVPRPHFPGLNSHHIPLCQGRAAPGATDDFQQYTFTCAAPEEQAKPLLDNEVSGQDGMCCQTPHLRFDGVPFHTTVITAPSAKPCALQSETSVGHYGQDVSASPCS